MSYKQDNLAMKRFIEDEKKNVGRCMPKPVIRRPRMDLTKYLTKTA
jgi:hypothetical protein